MLLQKSQPKLKPVTSKTIEEACKRASERLNELLNTRDIILRAAKDREHKTLKDYDEQWKESEFDWDTPLSQIPFHTPPNSCVVALYKANKLCALSRSFLLSTVKQERLFIIRMIESAPEHQANPLKGFAIAAASQVNLEISRISNIGFIGVDKPRHRTLKAYRNLGYNMQSTRPFMAVAKNLDLDKVIEIRNRQGLIPARYSSPTRP